MNKNIFKIFQDEKIVEKLQKKLPYLFQLVELDNSRDGKLGMEVGSAREKVIIAFLISVFGYKNIKTNIPIAKQEVDLLLFDKPVSIKTFTKHRIVGVKLAWTVDDKKSLEFINFYVPSVDILLVHIDWNKTGGFYFIPKEAQRKILKQLGREKYFKLPVKGTNNRGVEISNFAMKELLKNDLTTKIEIFWKRRELLKYDPYEKWVKLWKEGKS